MKFHRHTAKKTVARIRRKIRVKKRVSMGAIKPRLCVYRSNQHIYAQLIDDDKGLTLASASSAEKTFPAKDATHTKVGATEVGKLLAQRALAKNIITVCFDRGGFAYHGRVKAVAEAAREAGLKF